MTSKFWKSTLSWTSLYRSNFFVCHPEGDNSYCSADLVTNKVLHFVQSTGWITCIPNQVLISDNTISNIKSGGAGICSKNIAPLNELYSSRRTPTTHFPVPNLTRDKPSELLKMVSIPEYMGSVGSADLICRLNARKRSELLVNMVLWVADNLFIFSRELSNINWFGKRYGASLRKQVKKMEVSQHARYTCTFCGKVCLFFGARYTFQAEGLASKDSVKRTAVGIWHCRACKKTVAGGAWTVSTTAAATVRRYVTCACQVQSIANTTLVQHGPSVARTHRSLNIFFAFFPFMHIHLCYVPMIHESSKVEGTPRSKPPGDRNR